MTDQNAEVDVIIIIFYFSAANVSSNVFTIPPTTTFTDAWKPRLREVISSCSVHFTRDIQQNRPMRPLHLQLIGHVVQKARLTH